MTEREVFKAHWCRRVVAVLCALMLSPCVFTLADQALWFEFSLCLAMLLFVFVPMFFMQLTVGPRGLVSRRWWVTRVRWVDIIAMEVRIHPNPEVDEPTPSAQCLYYDPTFEHTFEDADDELTALGASAAMGVSAVLLELSGRLRATVRIWCRHGRKVSIPLNSYPHGAEIIDKIQRAAAEYGVTN